MPLNIALPGQAWRTGAALDTVELNATLCNRLAFIYEIDFAEIYDWLIKAATYSPDPACLKAARSLHKYMMVSRTE